MAYSILLAIFGKQD